MGKIVIIDRYEGETEDILKKIAEAGEPEENKATTKKNDKTVNLIFKETFFAYTCLRFLSDVMPESGVKKLVEMGFCEAPASTKYHGNHEGGLLEHSYEVSAALLNLSNDLGLKWKRKESPIIIGQFHDLCKIDQYIKNEDGTYSFNNEAPSGHGSKSVEYIEKYAGIKLTDEEKACILHHMGAFGDKDAQNAYTEAIKKYPNVLYTHTADMIASQIKNK